MGAVVVYGGLSSFVATLGLSFLIRGAVLIATGGKSIALTDVRDTLAYQVMSSSWQGLPIQVAWAVIFVAAALALYNRHQFGAWVKIVGDNPQSAEQMGIDSRLVRALAFTLMGFGAALAGVFSTMINFTWWPTAGEAYLLPALAAVFVGGTPTWGGTGTIIGAAIGALTVSLIQTGIVAMGLDGFYVQFFYGLIIILALLGHRWNQVRYR